MRELVSGEIEFVSGGLATKAQTGSNSTNSGGGGSNASGGNYRFCGITQSTFFQDMFAIVGGLAGGAVAGPGGAIVGGGIGGMVGQSVNYYSEGLHATPNSYVIAHLGRAA